MERGISIASAIGVGYHGSANCRSINGIFWLYVSERLILHLVAGMSNSRRLTVIFHQYVDPTLFSILFALCYLQHLIANRIPDRILDIDEINLSQEDGSAL